MKKALQAYGLLLALLLIGSGNLFARVTGTPPSTSDIVCFGPSGSELCQDSSANWLPTTTGGASLGSSSLKWSTVYTSGDLNNSGTLTQTGAATFSGRMNMTKTLVGTGTGNLGVYSSSGIPATTGYETVITSGVLVLISATPSVATGTVMNSGGFCCDSTSIFLSTGTELILTSTASAGGIILQDEGTLTGSRLQLGAATRQVSQFKTLHLIYDPADNFWREVAYSSN